MSLLLLCFPHINKQMEFDDTINDFGKATVLNRLTATFTPATPAATMAAAAATCPVDYGPSLKNEMSILKQPDQNDPASLGTAGLTLLKIRYKVEDATVPAGCEVGTKHFLQGVAMTEDYVFVLMAGSGDKANAKTYSDFFTNTIAARAIKLSDALKADFPSADATPAATASQ